MTVDWKRVLLNCGVRQKTVSAWYPAFESIVIPSNFSLGFQEIDDFVAQVLHESGMLERTVENLNYTSASRIRQVWPSRFKTDQDAQPFVRNPQGLANKVYGGRMGNRRPNDGWDYRGRGPIMVTGFENYQKLSEKLGIDLTLDPDKLALPVVGLKAAIAWWEGNVPDSVMGDVVKVTKRVNGGVVGLEHRKHLMQLVSAQIKAGI